MPRPKLPTPYDYRLRLRSVELVAKLELELASELEGKIPHGRIQEFLTLRIKEYFDWSTLNLAEFGFPDGYFIKGPKEMVEALREYLTEKETA